MYLINAMVSKHAIGVLGLQDRCCCIVIHLHVRAAIFLIIAMHIHKPSARFPYSKVQEYDIKMDGLPAGVSLKHPSSYGKDTLRNILSNKHHLKLYGIIMFTCIIMFFYVLVISVMLRN